MVISIKMAIRAYLIINTFFDQSKMDWNDDDDPQNYNV